MNPYAPKKALVGIDWQTCFSRQPGSLPGIGVGALYVDGAENALMKFNTWRATESWDFVAFSEDWHPPEHVSFASNHPGAAVFSTIETALGPQVLWPDHAVQGTAGAELDPDLFTLITDRHYKKGTNPIADSYSIVGDATPLKIYERTSILEDMRRAGIEQVYIGGLALNYCVAFSAIDIAKAGFQVFVLLAACRAVKDETVEAQMAAMTNAGVVFL